MTWIHAGSRDCLLQTVAITIGYHLPFKTLGCSWVHSTGLSPCSGASLLKTDFQSTPTSLQLTRSIACSPSPSRRGSLHLPALWDRMARRTWQRCCALSLRSAARPHSYCTQTCRESTPCSEWKPETACLRLHWAWKL